MTKVKVSNTPPSVEKMLVYANSIPAGYKIDHTLFPEDDAKKQREWFYDLIASLPEDFPQKYERLNKVVNGDSVSWETAVNQGSGALFEKAKKTFPRISKRIWFEYLLLKEECHEIAPLSELVNLLIAARACRRIFTRLVMMGSHPVGHTSGSKPVIPGERLNEVMLTRHPVTGVIELSAQYPLRVLISEQIDTRRIKSCDNCENFYWQKRENKNSSVNTCEKCRNKVNQKRYVERNKKQQNTERRKNYYYKNKIKFCENCVRPNDKCSCNSNKQEAQINATL